MMQCEQGIAGSRSVEGFARADNRYRTTIARALICCGLGAMSMLALPPAGALAGQTDVASAKTVTIHLDPSTTVVRWTLKSMLHNAHGTLQLKGGEIVTNPATGVAQGEVLIDAASGSSGDATRDAAWRKDTLDSATYPAIIFHPVKLEGLKSGDGTEQVKASGTLTLKGQDHPVEMVLTVTSAGKDVTVSSRFEIPYVQWGLKQPSGGLVRYEKQVEIEIAGKGSVKQETAVRSAPPAPDSQ